ncbi:ABC transporter permease [Paralimibaculum aggregatum]|uniref:ABC transporter permease n=1 Tax=Paralimibaculum aggregatum TaxID=3036245 RepID=A0ABQ6LJ81_9RHOB|nr:ABC transporter permease [Limibaculum sp. NKW23]GMG82466.1 ABC transporter permease [Limibaculum sp. NKW23]
MTSQHPAGQARRLLRPVARLWQSDLVWSFRNTPYAVVSLALVLAIAVTALCAHWVAPHDPFDLASFNILDSELPPAWVEGGSPEFILGTDTQGRDVLSLIIYGARLSLLVGLASVVFGLVLGVGLGLLSGYVGGWVDALVMRTADVKLSFPAILVALLVNGVARGFLPPEMHGQIAIPVLIFSIGMSGWVHYARTVRGIVMVERRKEYVLAAQIVGRKGWEVALLHVLPNTMSPVTVIATINLATAILLEATLSFLGVGVPPTEPSLGTLIKVGSEYMFSGIWWVTAFPSLLLVVLVLAVNLLGDWLRDALNPNLQ